MSLERAFRRLATQPSSLCQRCRRQFSSSASALQQRSTASVVVDALRSSEVKNNSARVQAATAPPAVQSQTSGSMAQTPASQVSEPFQMARRAIRQATSIPIEREAQQRARDMERNFSRKDLEQQMVRRWKPGDVYAPHDLSGAEMAKWKKSNRKPKTKYDVMDQLGINPLHHYKNVSIMSEYMSEMGRIRGSQSSGLRPVNQRRMAKAIRRAIGIGLMPGVHRHPELLKLEMENLRM